MGKFFICEASRLEKYVKVINTIREYKDGRSFPMNEVVTADKPINILATKKEDIGGLNVTNYQRKSYIQVLAYVSTQGFTETCYKIFEDKVNKENAVEVLDIYENFLQRKTNPMPDLYNEILEKIKEI